MATETNALATYDEITSLGVSVKGNYEPNQMVKYEDVVPSNTYYYKNTLSDDWASLHLDYKEYQIGETINNSNFKTTDIFFYKEPKNSKIDVRISGFTCSFATGTHTAHQIHDIKYTVQTVLYKAPCDASGNSISGPTNIYGKNFEYILPKGNNGGSTTTEQEELIFYFDTDNTIDKYYKIQLYIKVDATEKDGNIAQESVRTEAVVTAGAITYSVGCMENK